MFLRTRVRAANHIQQKTLEGSLQANSNELKYSTGEPGGIENATHNTFPKVTCLF
jgi:hypothetical protein